MLLSDLREKILTGGEITREEALHLTRLKGEALADLFLAATRIRGKRWGGTVNLCSIVNTKSGDCSEDCAFCSQSAHYSTSIQVYPLITVKEILNHAKEAKAVGTHRFCIVTSGRTIYNKEEMERIAEGISRIKNEALLSPCATLGLLDKAQLQELAEAGLHRYHHNLETAEEFFPHICSTHTYQEKINTIKSAKELGLSTCSGGIFGMGESWKHRIDLAYALKELDVDSVPINFLKPVAGTPLEKERTLTPLEALKIIAIFRFILPDKEIRVCGGRIAALRDLHSLIFQAGADGLLIGNYLTYGDRIPHDDLQMIEDLGLTLRYE